MLPTSAPRRAFASGRLACAVLMLQLVNGPMADGRAAGYQATIPERHSGTSGTGVASVPKIAPSAFRGDVRSLPQVPLTAPPALTLKGPTSTRQAPTALVTPRARVAAIPM